MSTLRLTTISNQTGSSSVPSQTVISGSAKAWVNFNGTGTVAIRASFNVSSITDLTTGSYVVNFTTAMIDVNYVALASSQQTSSTAALVTWAPRISGLLTGSFNVSGVPENSTGGGPADVLELRCAVFR